RWVRMLALEPSVHREIVALTLPAFAQVATLDQLARAARRQ
ncbi:LysR family transcriptional regulator, partial [Streptomyces sp. KR55]